MKPSTMVVVLVIASAAAMLSACTPTVPDCAGENVKGLIYDMARRELAEFIFIDNDPDYIYLAKGETLERIIAESNHEPYVQNATEAIREAAGVAMKLHGIRTNSRDEEARAAACAATLDRGDWWTLEITYKAQYSEDGMVYVEVVGL